MPGTKEKLVWYAPKWSTNPRQWWVLRKYLFSRGPLVRISVASLAGTLLVVAAIKIAIPQIALPNIWPVFLALPALLGLVDVNTAMWALFRERILVTSKKILITHGQSATLIRPEFLTRVTLTTHAGNKARIRFDYTDKSKPRSRTVGVSDECNLFQLAELLPIEIVVRDARRGLSGGN